MRASDWLKEMKDFIHFCGQFDPRIPRTIIEATENEVAQVEALAGLCLPPEYRALLLTMGRTPPQALGNLLQYETYGIEALQKYYSDPLSATVPDAVYLWTFEIDSPFDIFLPVGGDPAVARPLLQVSRSLDPDTWEYRDGFDICQADSSLFHYLYKNCVDKVRYPLLAHTSDLRLPVEQHRASGQPGRVKRFRATAEHLGFTQVPYLDGDETYYNRADSCALYYSSAVAGDRLLTGAADKRELARLCEIFSDNLNLQKWA